MPCIGTSSGRRSRRPWWLIDQQMRAQQSPKVKHTLVCLSEKFPSKIRRSAPNKNIFQSNIFSDCELSGFSSRRNNWRQTQILTFKECTTENTDFEKKHKYFEKKHKYFEKKHKYFGKKHKYFEKKLKYFEKKHKYFEKKHKYFEEKKHKYFDKKHKYFEKEHKYFQKKHKYSLPKSSQL